LVARIRKNQKKVNIKFTKAIIIFANIFIKAFLTLKFWKFKNLINIKNVLVYLKKRKLVKLIINNFINCENNVKKGYLITIF